MKHSLSLSMLTLTSKLDISRELLLRYTLQIMTYFHYIMTFYLISSILQGLEVIMFKGVVLK